MPFPTLCFFFGGGVDLNGSPWGHQRFFWLVLSLNSTIKWRDFLKILDIPDSMTGSQLPLGRSLMNNSSIPGVVVLFAGSCERYCSRNSCMFFTKPRLLLYLDFVCPKSPKNSSVLRIEQGLLRIHIHTYPL